MVVCCVTMLKTDFSKFLHFALYSVLEFCLWWVLEWGLIVVVEWSLDGVILSSNCIRIKVEMKGGKRVPKVAENLHWTSSASGLSARVDIVVTRANRPLPGEGRDRSSSAWARFLPARVKELLERLARVNNSSARANLVLLRENGRQKLVRSSELPASSSEGVSGRLHSSKPSAAFANLDSVLGMVPALDLD